MVLLLVLLLVGACRTQAGGITEPKGSPPGTTETQPVVGTADPQMGDIVTCALHVLGPAVKAGTATIKIATDPDVFLAKATEILHQGMDTGDFVAAVLRVYGRPTALDLSPEEAKEVILLISGVDSCTKVSDPLRQSADGILDLLISFVQPGYTGSEPDPTSTTTASGTTTSPETTSPETTSPETTSTETTSTETTASTTEASVSSSDVAGVWQGTYSCAQGETGVRLTISSAEGSAVEAIFDFFAIASNPNVPSGSFAMRGSFTTDGLRLTQDHWIQQPDGYMMIDLTAPPPTNGSMQGTITTAGCGTISVSRG